MLAYILPIVLVIVSNTIYQICAKSVPSTINPFAALTVTYLVAAVISAVLYFTLDKNANLIREYRNLNRAPFVLGIVIVGLEVGFIYAYKARLASKHRVTRSKLICGSGIDYSRIFDLSRAYVLE